jgi:hypothetical protein
MLSEHATMMQMGRCRARGLLDKMPILTAMNDGSKAMLRAWLGTGRERKVTDGGVKTLMGCGGGSGLRKACCCGTDDAC